jgi:hypothetical protein
LAGGPCAWAFLGAIAIGCAGAESDGVQSAATSAPAAVLVDFGRRQQDVAAGYMAWSEVTSASSPAFGGVQMTIKSAESDGSLAWRTRQPVTGPLGDLVEDAVTSRGGLKLTFQALAAGFYELRTYHHDSGVSSSPGTLDVLVTDADSPAGRMVVQAIPISVGRTDAGVTVQSTSIRADGHDVSLTVVRRSANEAWLNGFELRADSSSFLRLSHDGTSASVHVIDQTASPASGSQTVTLPALTANLTVTADGHALAFTQPANPNGPEVLASFTVPSGTLALRLSYDQTDASLPYESLWYLEFDRVVGPKHLTIDLPAGASVTQNNIDDSDPDPHHVVFDVPDGQEVDPLVVYSAPDVPDLYDTIITPHFEIRLAQAHRAYDSAVTALLENAYAIHVANTGQQVNQFQALPRYPFAYPPGGFVFGGAVLSGGLSFKGQSTVNARLVPLIAMNMQFGSNLMVAISLHELGNGWGGLWESPDPNNRPPSWIDNEGHAGFLRAQAELDLGYCADAQREQADHFADFAACTSDCAAEIPLVSLQARYGWAPLRAYYAGIQSGAFDFSGLDEVGKADLLAEFFSQQVGQNLTSFFDAIHVTLSAQMRSELAMRFPPANVPIIQFLTCRPATLRVTPSPLPLKAYTGEATASAAVYACAPAGWSAKLSTTRGLTLSPAAATSCGAAQVVATVGTTGQGSVGTLSFQSSGAAGSPKAVPLQVSVAAGPRNILRDGGFEGTLSDNWSLVEFESTSTLAKDTSVFHSGKSSARIVSPTENDARAVETVTIRPNTVYRLTGFVRLQNGSLGSGPNVALELPDASSFARSGPDLAGTRDWRFVSVSFLSGSATSLLAEARLGFYSDESIGTAWFDDLSLEDIGR